MKSKSLTELNWDPEVDAASLRLRRGVVRYSLEVESGIIFDYNLKDQVVRIEILDFSKRFRNAGRKSNKRQASRKLPFSLAGLE